MGIILTGPINIETAANLLASIKRAFYTQNDVLNINTETTIWKPELIISPPSGLLSDNNDLNRLYQSARKANNWGLVKSSPRDYAMSIRIFNNNGFNVKSDIMDMTSLEDMVSGQIIPSPIKKIFIYSYNNNGSLFNRFLEYRNQMVLQAQERLNQSVSKAAYNIVNDLHK